MADEAQDSVFFEFSNVQSRHPANPDSRNEIEAREQKFVETHLKNSSLVIDHLQHLLDDFWSVVSMCAKAGKCEKCQPS